MPQWKREYGLIALLAALVAILGVGLAAEWLLLARSRAEDSRLPPARVSGSVQDPVLPRENFELPALDAYQEMIQRPLFMENRRPGAETVEAAPPPPPPPMPMNLKLMGVVHGPSGKTALLVDGKGKYKRLKTKDTLDGWTLVELGADRVTMQQGDKLEQLPLLKKKPKAPPQVPPGQPPRPGQPGQPGPIPPAAANVPPAKPIPPAGNPDFADDTTEEEYSEEDAEIVDEGSDSQ